MSAGDKMAREMAEATGYGVSVGDNVAKRVQIDLAPEAFALGKLAYDTHKAECAPHLDYIEADFERLNVWAKRAWQRAAEAVLAKAAEPERGSR